MPEIEFVDLPDGTDGLEATTTPARIPRRPIGGLRGRTVTALLWTAAAAACVVAPFATLYSIDLPHRRGSDSVDGWGRIHATGAFGGGGEHGERYGIILVAIAGLLLAAAVLTVLPRTGGSRAPGVAALVATGGLAGALAVLYLDLKEIKDLTDGRDLGGGDRVTVTYGGVLWLGFFALALAVSGLVWRGRSTTPAEPDPAPDEPPGHPEDESLPT